MVKVWLKKKKNKNKNLIFNYYSSISRLIRLLDHQFIDDHYY